MKNTFRLSPVILLFLSISLTHSCKKDITPPIITTATASAITQTTATSGGNVTSDGGASVTVKGVCWYISAGATVENSKTSDGAGAGIFASSMTALTAGTVYYVKAYATNSAGTSYGNEISFTSSASTGPLLTTSIASAITQSTAESGGNITSDGGAAITVRGVCWSTTSGPTTALSTKTTDGTGSGIFASSMTGLTAGTVYYVKAYATNSAGTDYGNEISFTSSSTIPGAPRGVTALARYAQATITFSAPISNGGSVITGYTVTSNPGNITGTGTASPITLTGLTNGTEYTFTVRATNAIGTSVASSASNSVTPSVTTQDKPTANFTYSLDNSNQVPCNASFVNTSTNATSYKWYFSNGNTSSVKNPQTVFSSPRIFNVKLVATNPIGSDSVTKSMTVNPIMKSVLVYLITPKDNQFNPDYYNALKNETITLQAWYKSQMGNNKTFVLNPLVLDTLRGLHNNVWYNSNNGSISGTDPRFYAVNNTRYEMQQLLGSRFNTSDYVFFVYVAAPGDGAGSMGFCAMGDQDLKGLLGQNTDNLDPNRWIGGGGHELGHAFGLNHPDNLNEQAIMWTGYAIYPNCILQQNDKDILNASPFFR
jgi:PKD repeat protein